MYLHPGFRSPGIELLSYAEQIQILKFGKEKKMDQAERSADKADPVIKCWSCKHLDIGFTLSSRGKLWVQGPMSIFSGWEGLTEDRYLGSTSLTKSSSPRF